MSANNWAECPRCAQGQREKAAKLRLEADQAYGVVPVAEWMRLAQAAREADKPLDDQTFREDYSFYGAENGVICADYSGACTVCGLQASLKAEKVFYPAQVPA